MITRIDERTLKEIFSVAEDIQSLISPIWRIIIDEENGAVVATYIIDADSLPGNLDAIICYEAVVTMIDYKLAIKVWIGRPWPE